MTAPRLLKEVQDISSRSITFAKGIDHATAGSRLSEIMRKAMSTRPAAYGGLRAAVQARLAELGGAGEATGLFMLAADMATTASMASINLTPDDRRQLRRLWDELRAQ
jgi:hypothetical protein